MSTARRAIRTLLRVLVSAVVTQPNVVTSFNKFEREAPIFFRSAYPNLAIHEKTMMEIDDFFRDASGAPIYTGTFLSLLKRKPMETKKITILRLNNVFFRFIAVECAELSKIGRNRNR